MKLSTVFISHLNDLILEIDLLDGDFQTKQIMEYRMRILRELASEYVTGRIEDEQLDAINEICEERMPGLATI